MRRRPLTLVAALGACTLLLALPAAAPAAKRFSGESEQGRGVKLRIGDDRLVQRLEIKWRARCNSGKNVTSEVRFPGGFFVESTKNRFEGRGPYRASASGGFRLRVQATVTGRRTIKPGGDDPETWKGTLRTKTVVRKNGKVVDRCTSRKIDWKVERGGGR